MNIDVNNINLQNSKALGSDSIIAMIVFDHKIDTNLAFLVSRLQGWLYAVKHFYIRT